ncbi:hypothetical protein EDD86DRAFT_276522 [Gorgonomyces haynaldii]|nr:hypothetical protein EDD86DRAFT_276522 [Gorgonomyces haynaldii]
MPPTNSRYYLYIGSTFCAGVLFSLLFLVPLSAGFSKLPRWTPFRLITTVLLVAVLTYLGSIAFSVESDVYFPKFSYMALSLFCFSPVLAFKGAFSVLPNAADLLPVVHAVLSTVGVLLATIHGLLYLCLWVRYNALLAILKQDTANIYAIVLLVILLLMFLTSLPPVRHLSFALFKIFHFLAYPLILVFAYMHQPNTLPFILPAFVLQLLNLVWSIFSTRKATVHVTTAGPVTRLTLTVNHQIHPRPGQHIYVYKSMIGHPFSIVSAKQVEGMTTLLLGIKNGKFTQDLTGPLRISRPLGNTFDPLFKYDHLVLIAGGIGITPLLSIAQKAERVSLIWIVKDQSWLEGFRTELDLLESRNVHLETYLTTNGRPDLSDLIQKQASMAIGVCGPKGLVGDVIQIGSRLKIPVHFELFY